MRVFDASGSAKDLLILRYIAADTEPDMRKAQINGVDSEELTGSDKNMHIVDMIDVGPEKSPVLLGDKLKNKKTEWSGACTIYVGKDDEKGTINSDIIEKHGDHVNMSDPEVLTNFLIKNTNRFPADKKMVIFDAHGFCIAGVITDNHDGSCLSEESTGNIDPDYMSITDLDDSFKNAEKATGKRTNIIGFDACQMALIENAYQLRDDADYMIASADEEGVNGWRYDKLYPAIRDKEAENGSSVSPKDIAKIIIDSNENNQENISIQTAIDLNVIKTIPDCINNLSDAIINSNDKPAIKKSIIKAETFGDSEPPLPDCHDFYDICQNLQKNSSDPAVKKAAQEAFEKVEEAIPFKEADRKKHPTAAGLAIYSPVNGNIYDGYKKLDFSRKTRWLKAMKSLAKYKV